MSVKHPLEMRNQRSNKLKRWGIEEERAAEKNKNEKSSQYLHFLRSFFRDEFLSLFRIDFLILFNLPNYVRYFIRQLFRHKPFRVFAWELQFFSLIWTTCDFISTENTRSMNLSLAVSDCHKGLRALIELKKIYLWLRNLAVNKP